MKKRAFTLLEVLISCSLLTLLMGTLFFSYRQVASPLPKEEEESFWKVREESFVQKRLTRVFKTAETLFSTEKSLVFTFERPPSDNPYLSGTVLGALFHDPQENVLALTLWPDPQTHLRTPSETTLLLENVKKATFSFYFPPPSTYHPVDPQKIGDSYPLTGWQDVWKKTYQTLPVMLKICVTYGNDQTVDYIFDLPSQAMVTY